jgi:hypothetical protein
MLGEFPFSDTDSPLLRMNKVFLDNIEKEAKGEDFQRLLENAGSNEKKIQLFNKYFQYESSPETG